MRGWKLSFPPYISEYYLLCIKAEVYASSLCPSPYACQFNSLSSESLFTGMLAWASPPEASDTSSTGPYAENKNLLILKHSQIPPEGLFVANLLNFLQSSPRPVKIGKIFSEDRSKQASSVPPSAHIPPAHTATAACGSVKCSFTQW